MLHLRFAKPADGAELVVASTRLGKVEHCRRNGEYRELLGEALHMLHMLRTEVQAAGIFSEWVEG